MATNRLLKPRDEKEQMKKEKHVTKVEASIRSYFDSWFHWRLHGFSIFFFFFFLQFPLRIKPVEKDPL